MNVRWLVNYAIALGIVVYSFWREFENLKNLSMINGIDIILIIF